MMWIIEFEKMIIEEILSNWEAFLFSQDIYWPLQINVKGTPPQYKNVRLSIGRVLIAVELVGSPLAMDESSNFYSKEILSRFYHLRNQWKANWDKKVHTEIQIRLRQWQRFVYDLERNRDLTDAQLKKDVQVRLMIELLLLELEKLNRLEYEKLLLISDRRFRASSNEGSFVLDQGIENIFPISQYWYLYRCMQQPGGR